MQNLITTEIIGILVCVLGILNMSGHISSLHKYHRHRVSEEDRIPFGRLVGLGTILCGAGIIIFGILSIVTTLLEKEVFTLIGSGIMIIFLIAGLGISFWGMIKYNKGIF